MAEITEENKKDDFSHVAEKNSLRAELEEVERMINNYYDRVDARDGRI